MGANRFWQGSSGFCVGMDRRAERQEWSPVRKHFVVSQAREGGTLAQVVAREEPRREGTLGWLLKDFLVDWRRRGKESKQSRMSQGFFFRAAEG